MDQSVIAAWDHELCIASNEIDQLRRAYIAQLKPVFEQTLAKLLELPGLTLSYFRGWDKNSELQKCSIKALSATERWDTPKQVRSVQI